MGTYKVPQNVESEDKILGPLSMKQFIYAIIGLGYGFVTFALFHNFIPLWIIVGVPPMLFMLALGLYQREDQPLETYVLAVAQYFVRPRIRLWHKEPIAEVFRIQPPPPKPQALVRDPTQVRSQLEQLAGVVDTRGWAAKQPEVQDQGVIDEAPVPVIDLEGRIGAEALSEPQVAPVIEAPEITQEDDVLDANSQAAQNIGVLIENSTKSIRAEAMEKMQHPTAPKPAKKTASTAPKSTTAMTAPPSGDILKLAVEGGDLTVAQVAAQAHKQQPITEGQTVRIRDGNNAAA